MSKRNSLDNYVQAARIIIIIIIYANSYTL